MKETKKKSPRSGKKDTAPEKEVSQILERHNILYIREYQLFGKYYDFYLPEYNILCEVDGNYWHGKDQEKLTRWQVSQQIEDIYKNSIAAVNEIKLIRIWEDEIDEDKLVTEIKSCPKRQNLFE